MRFVRIVVKNFQALEGADVEFAPGLNVIFGPNDLGKSTLASALRAALLVPPSSSEASGYRPWSVDAVPEVTLTFQDDDDRYWRVRKLFGATASQTAAELHQSKDGSTFNLVCRAREVEDELRKLLAWGIPSPGGKGAPRGLPRSFLSNVLLAEQTDVDTIFGQSLQQDGTTSGKDRLRKALAALAEDPRFKAILGEVQSKVTEYFSPSGQRRRGRESRFTLVAEEIKRRAERVEELRKGVAQSESTEKLIVQLRESYSSVQEAHSDAKTTLEDVHQQHLRAAERARAEAERAAAAEAVSALDRQAEDVLERERALTELVGQVSSAESQAVVARQDMEAADLAVRQAEAALRAATSEEGAHQRELRRAQLEAERAELIVQTTETQKHVEALQTAQAAGVTAQTASAAEVEARAAVEQARTNEATAKGESVDAERELEFARGLLAYGHLLGAREAGEQAAHAKTNADALRAEVISKGTAAEQRESQAAERAGEANALRVTLPDPALMARLDELNHDLTIAEAALGGGFSVAVRGSGKIPVHVSLDGRDAIAGTAVDGRIVLEANRTAALRAGDLLDIEIVAGAADQRRAVEVLRERWAHEAEPILARAGASNLREISEHLHRAAALDAGAEELKREVKQLRTEAEAARQAAEVQEQREAELRARAGEADAIEPKLTGLDATLLAARFSKLGPGWKQATDELVADKERALSLAREKLASATRESEVAAFRAADAAGRATAAKDEAARARVTLHLANTDSDPDPLATAMAGTKAALAGLSSRRDAIDERFEALAAEDTSAVTSAQAALDSAQATRERALTEQTQKIEALSEARSRCDTARGHTMALRGALEATDRAGAEARLTTAQAALEQFAQDALLPPDALQTAQHRELEARNALARVRRELDQAEGALSKVGGDPLREKLLREQEALDVAKGQQRRLELEADAWKLLREALQEAEKDGTSHLGSSLAGPLSTRLAELTGSRYGGVRLDQHLGMEGVDVAAVANAENVLDALSVGTRDQIATLLRLTIAEQLKSAIVLDDHLAHTDPERLAWFRRALGETAQKTQVIVITCRAEDYLDRARNADDSRETARAIDFARVGTRFEFVARRETKVQ